MTAQEFKYQALIDKTLIPNAYMKFVAGISDPDLTSKICIELPAFCDPQLLSTIESYKKNAANPDRLIFAVCFQDDDTEVLHVLESMQNCKVKHFAKEKAPGLCAARYECNKMVSAETYVLHTDSHMRAAKHWDVAMIKIWELCHDDKAVISGYPLDYTCYLDRDVDDPVFTEQVRDEASPVGVVSHFDLHGTIRFRGGNLHKEPQNIRGMFISGGCVFGKAELDHICPSDPDMFFTADEISMDIRYFTHGFHVYHPMFMPIWHLYGIRKDENQKPVERFNTKSDDYNTKRVLEDRRMRFLTGLLDEDIDLKGFGCGEKHTFQEFLTVSGIDFAHHAVRGFAKTGHFFALDERLTDEEKKWHCYEMTEDRTEHVCDTLVLPPAPDEEYASICVEIPCFKDRQIVTTVQSLLYQADHPERVHFAICLQEDDLGIIRALSMDMHIRYHLVDPKDAKGTGAARQMAAGLYCNEDYVLITDAHMLAVKHWDTMMIRQLYHIPDSKAVLTAQVDDFGPCRGKEFWRGCFDMPYPVAVFGIDSFVHGEVPGLLYNNHYAGYLREKYKGSTEPDVYVRTFGLTARYIFARGSFNDDVPFSETAVYRGDECMPSVIAFTKGYHAYTYYHGYLLHDSLSQRQRPLSAVDRKRRLSESSSMQDLVTKGYTIDTELGQKQTIEDLKAFLGVDFENHRIYKRAYLSEPGTVDVNIESIGTHLAHDFYEERTKSRIYVVSVFNDETGYSVPEGESQYTAFKNSLLENADRPENVVVCAFKINDGRTYGFHVNQFMDSLDASEDDIILFTDGAVRFLPGWDDHLIQNFMGLNPHMVWSTNTYANAMTAPYKNPAVKITYNPVATSVIAETVENKGPFVNVKPVFLRGIIAMRLKTYHEIPFDPNISYADHCTTYHLRLYTHGYDIWYDELSYLYRTRLIQHLDNITEPDRKLRGRMLGSLYEDYDGNWINYPYGHGRVRNLLSWYRQLGFIDTNRNATGTALF